jgi:nicotinate phosphoribosyltransferase
MSIFNHQRLNNDTFKLDAGRMRQGWYTDKYFVNIAQMLTILAEQKYEYQGCTPRFAGGMSLDGVQPGDIEVEMQWFTRRMGKTIVVGVDKALAMLEHCTGY